ncbi:MAG: hypothetical protein P4L61_03865, partial [Candidatus Pacebacteria bacterium]|nr:hypothetical protein [Candidatus Paceibacterota bacterium]
MNVGLEWITNSVLLFVGDTFLTLMGVLLNGVMIMTLNMSSLVNSIGVVDSTWSIIRDIASILIIFFLLYTSIEIIIGVDNSKVQHIIVMVVVAGVLINFSLFFTKVLVDTSNLVSLAFYRAIAPSGANYDFSAQAGSASYLSNAFTSGGLSNEIMTGLGVTSIYQMASSTYNTSTSGTNPLLIIGSGVGGFIIMMMVGLSFLAAAILFSVRIGLLIILMAFSPFYFIGFIIPNIKSKISDKWRDLLLAQCMIMPVYMLFMYVALRVITAPAFKSFVHPTGGASTGVAGVSVGVIGLIVQYIIGMIFISIPLIAAMEYASFGKDFANMATNKVKSWGKSAVG